MTLPETDYKPARRWTVIASALLIAALGLVVFYTSRRAFFSPLAVMVVAAIGLAALLLQIRFRHDLANSVRTPIWLNALGIVCAFAAVFGDKLKMDSQLTELMALAAVGCFAISGVIVLDAIRKHRAISK